MIEEKLTQQQELAAQLVAIGGKQKTEIAKDVGVSRTTLYNWMDKDEFKAEVDKLKQEYRNFGNDLILSKLHKSIENIVDLSNTSKNDMVRFNASTYLIDRIYGKIPSSLTLKTEVENVKQLDEDILEAEFEEWDADIEEGK